MTHPIDGIIFSASDFEESFLDQYKTLDHRLKDKTIDHRLKAIIS